MPSATDPRSVYRLFFNPGEVTEIRAFGLSGENKAWQGRAFGDGATVFGYFDNAEDFGRSAEALDKAGADGVYFTPNLPKPALINRISNKLGTATKKRPATSNHDVYRLRWLLVDFDSVHPAGISASDEELGCAMETAKAAAAKLSELGFAAPIKAMSGNGYHLVYRLPDTDLDEAAIMAGKCPYTSGQGLLARCLAAIHHLVGNPRCKIDVVNHNASRIWKLYGTTARKGENTKATPHRRSFIFPDAPEDVAEVPVTPLELLEQLAALGTGNARSERTSPNVGFPAGGGSGPATRPATPGAADSSGNGSAALPATRKPAARAERVPPGPGLGKLKVEDWLSAHGREIHCVEEKAGTTWFILRECVFNPDHKAKDAAILQTGEGKLLYHCSHNSCKGHTFKEAKAIVSGEKSLKEWMEGYDPNWKPAPGDAVCLSADGEAIDAIERMSLCQVAGCDTLKAPADVDPMAFFEVRGQHGRPAFVVDRIARYLRAYLAPLAHTDSVFYRYKGGVWRPMKQAAIEHLAGECLKERVQADWIKQTVAVLGCQCAKMEEDWQPDHYLINVRNGMVDLQALIDGADLDHVLKPHAPEQDSRSQLAVEYDPDAVCNRWIKFLWEVFPEGRDRPPKDGALCKGDQKFVMAQQFAGYCLLPHNRFEKAAFLTGAGANGKSTFINLLSHVLGDNNTMEMALDQLARTFAIPSLQGKLLITCTEMHTKETSAIQMLKACISGDEISGEYKYAKERITFRPACKFVFALNEIPSIVDKSYGFVRKLLILNFAERFEGERRDPDLFEKLQAEANGIFLWMLQGAVELVKQGGFKEMEGTEYDKSEFMQNLNPFLLYVAERCEINPEHQIACEGLFNDYVTWIEKSKLATLGKIKFYQSVAHYLPMVKKVRAKTAGGEQPYMFKGIGLKMGGVG
jgi:P4 family phage/plasmid primase-like protien